VLSNTSGEDYQALLVSLETSDIDGEGFGGEVGTAWVDGDTNGRGIFAGDSSFLLETAINSCFITLSCRLPYLELS
jgi:hypothetical protein